MNRKSIIEINNKEARNFFLKPESYFTTQLPDYFDLARILNDAKTLLLRRTSNLTSKWENKDFIICLD